MYLQQSKNAATAHLYWQSLNTHVSRKTRVRRVTPLEEKVPMSSHNSRNTTIKLIKGPSFAVTRNQHSLNQHWSLLLLIKQFSCCGGSMTIFSHTCATLLLHIIISIQTTNTNWSMIILFLQEATCDQRQPNLKLTFIWKTGLEKTPGQLQQFHFDGFRAVHQTTGSENHIITFNISTLITHLK